MVLGVQRTQFGHLGYILHVMYRKRPVLSDAQDSCLEKLWCY